MPHNILQQQKKLNQVQQIELFKEEEYQGWSNLKKSQQYQSSSNILNVLSNNLKSYQNLYNQSKKMKNNQLKMKHKHKRCSTITSKPKINDQINIKNLQKSKNQGYCQDNEHKDLQYASNKQNMSNVTNSKLIMKRLIKPKSSNAILSQVKIDLNSLILAVSNQKNGINFGQVKITSKRDAPIQNQVSSLNQQIQGQNKFKICNSYNLTESLDERVKINRTTLEQKSKIHNKFHSNRQYLHKKDEVNSFSKRVESETKRKYSCQILKPHEMKFGQNVKVVKKRRDAFIELFGYKHRKIQLNSTLKDFSDSAFFIKQKLNSRQIERQKTRQI